MSGFSRTGAVSGIAQRLNAERLVLLGWTRAILLQLAHPLIAAGVYEHSSFRATPLAAASRLHATVRAMLALSFGDETERGQALQGIRTIHARVHGQLREAVGVFPAGTAYSAEDPALVLWVHLTLLESIPLAYERFVGPVNEHDRDRYCAESAWVAASLGARPADIPTTWQHASDLLSRVYSSGVLRVGSQGREIAEAVLAPRLSRLVPPLAAWNRRISVGLLPPTIREQYGLSWSDADDRRFNRSVARLRRIRRRLPDIVALWPEARA